MKIGAFTIEILSEGRFEIFEDGHINRVATSDDGSPLNKKLSGSDSSVVVGINPVLVKADPYNILLDTGLGWGLDAGSNYQDVSNVRTNLEVFGLEPKDITHVILSHLHYDHAAGCSYNTPDYKTEATFPNATYYLHEKEWEHALSQEEKDQCDRRIFLGRHGSQSRFRPCGCRGGGHRNRKHDQGARFANHP